VVPTTRPSRDCRLPAERALFRPDRSRCWTGPLVPQNPRFKAQAEGWRRNKGTGSPDKLRGQKEGKPFLLNSILREIA